MPYSWGHDYIGRTKVEDCYAVLVQVRDCLQHVEADLQDIFFSEWSLRGSE
jgi:hypothetical protein